MDGMQLVLVRFMVSEGRNVPLDINCVVRHAGRNMAKAGQNMVPPSIASPLQVSSSGRDGNIGKSHVSSARH